MATKNPVKKERTSKEKEGNTKSRSNELKQEALVTETVYESEYEPEEHKIRELAETLYANRLESGEPGSAIDDWLRAEAYLRRSVSMV